MNLTKGKIAKLYSKKRQSKKKYNKKRYRKNRTLRKTRGFNLAKRTLRHVKRGGQKTTEEIEIENGLCLSDCRKKFPNEESTEYKECTQQCDDNEENQKKELQQLNENLSMVPSLEEIEINRQKKLKKEMATALEIEKDKKIAQGLQTEYNTELLNEISRVSSDERVAQDLDEQQKLDEQRSRSDAELARTLTKPVSVQEHPLQDTSTITADEQQQQHQEPQLPATTQQNLVPPSSDADAINSVSAIASDSSVSGVPSGRLLDGDQDLIPNNAIASDDSLLPQETDPLQTPSLAAPVVVEQTIVPGAVVPVKVEQTADVVEESVVEPSAPPLSSTPPPPANEDKLSQAIDTIVDHLSTKIAERINLTQGTTSGQQNGFESVNAAALNSQGGRKPSRRLINRRRRNKSHKKKKH
jgi:hypothetical protein